MLKERLQNIEKDNLKREKRNTRLLELGLGDKTELINHISRKFVHDISDKMDHDMAFMNRKQNKELFLYLLKKHSVSYVNNFISSMNKESLETLLIEFNKIEN